MRFCQLSHRRAGNAQARLHTCTVSQEPSLLTYTQSMGDIEGPDQTIDMVPLLVAANMHVSIETRVKTVLYGHSKIDKTKVLTGFNDNW